MGMESTQFVGNNEKRTFYGLVYLMWTVRNFTPSAQVLRCGKEQFETFAVFNMNVFLHNDLLKKSVTE